MADYLGIDPGLNGGFAVISDNEIRCKIAMPTISFTTREDNTKTEIDREGVLSFLKIFPPHVHVVIELQEAFRSQNITSTCTTCKNYGMLLMALTVARCYVTEVPASVWQEHYGIVSVKKSKGETTKQQAYRIAQAKYPDVDFRKSRRAQKPHDGIVDATLIAGYCQSLFAPSTDMLEPLEAKTIVGIEGTVKPLECKPGGKETGAKLKRMLF